MKEAESELIATALLRVNRGISEAQAGLNDIFKVLKMVDVVRVVKIIEDFEKSKEKE